MRGHLKIEISPKVIVGYSLFLVLTILKLELDKQMYHKEVPMLIIYDENKY